MKKLVVVSVLLAFSASACAAPPATPTPRTVALFDTFGPGDSYSNSANNFGSAEYPLANPAKHDHAQRFVVPADGVSYRLD